MLALRKLFAVLFISAAGAAIGPAAASVITFETDLLGSQEVPATGSPGTGHGTVTVDTTLRTLLVNLTFANLLAPTTASHIHCCAPFGTNATVATQVPTFAGFPLGVTSGTYSNLFDMSLATSYNPTFVSTHGGTPLTAFDALIAGMLAGQSYLNIHTAQFPGGEIRGQLTRVPEPGPLALLVIAATGMLAALRRARAAPLVTASAGRR